MTFLAPLWLLSLVGLPAIFLLYLIRSRYRREQVASVLLWRGVPRDLLAHRDWRRPRWELLLIVQLLAALAAALALGRLGIQGPPNRSLAIVLDASASMRAQDVAPTRFDAARREALQLAATVGPDDWVGVVLAGARPRLLATNQHGSLDSALNDLQPEAGAADMAAALRMATGLAGARTGFQGQVVVVTDGAFALDKGPLPEWASVSFRLVGGTATENVALSQVSLRRPLDIGRQVPGFASAVNFGAAPVTAPLLVIADGVQMDSREVTIPARGRADVTFQVPSESRSVVVQMPVVDALPADDRIEIPHTPASSTRPILIVSEEPALWGRVLDAVPYVTWRALRPADYDAHQLTPQSIAIFDRFVPNELPKNPLLLVEPPPPLFTPVGAPRPARAAELDRADPLLRGLDIAPLTARRATPVRPPDWASVDVADVEGAPLVMHGVLDSQRMAIFAFDPSSSNLPQLAAFPLLVTNIVDWLSPGRGDETHAGPGAKADIAPRPESVAAIAARAQSSAPAGNLEVWPLLVVLALGLVLVEWAITGSRDIVPGRRLPRFSAVMLRGASIACLGLALLRPGINLPDDAINVVFAVDTSDRISSEARQMAVSWLSSALDAQHPNDRVGVVGASADTHVVRAPAPDLTSIALPGSGTGRVTDLALSLRTAAGLARGNDASHSGRVVLLSDGRSPAGDLDAAIAEIADVPVDVVPLTALPRAPTIAMERLELPQYVRSGETFEATALARASQPTSATVQVSIDGQLTSEDRVRLAPGVNRITISQTLAIEGFHRLTTRLVGPPEVESGDNVADGFVVVRPIPRVLVVDERRGEGAPIQAMLQSAALRVDGRRAEQLPPMVQLEDYAAVVLANVSATSFTLDQQKALRTYVEANGHGLVVLGGGTSYGLGSYADSVLEQALPVTSTVPPKREDARLALLLIIDNSQSMSRKSEGVSSMQMAKEAAILATRSLDDRDLIGVLSFNHRFQWLVQMGPVGAIGRQALEERLGRLEAEGGTEIFGALSEGATAMLATQADLRHIVLFTDGQSRTANYDPLMSKLRTDKIGVSTIGLGAEADTQLLSSLAKLGEGRYYFTERTSELPRIMTREVAISKRSAQVEGTIHPQLVSSSPILRGIAPSEVPPLNGFVATAARPEAQLVLAAEDDRPLLSQWHFGLGRTVAWTSDVGPGWASAWQDWARAPRLWEQAVRWAMGPAVQRDFQVQIRTIGRQAEITLDTVRDGRFADLESPTATITGPSRAASVPLRQVAPGRYTATVSAEVPGAYEVAVATHPEAPGTSSRSETSGFVLPPLPAQVSIGADEHVLRRIASETGGRVLSSPASAFRSEGRPHGERSEPIWQPAVLAGLIFFLMDIARRRLALQLSSFRSWRFASRAYGRRGDVVN